MSTCCTTVSVSLAASSEVGNAMFTLVEVRRFCRGNLFVHHKLPMSNFTALCAWMLWGEGIPIQIPIEWDQLVGLLWALFQCSERGDALRLLEGAKGPKHPMSASPLLELRKVRCIYTSYLVGEQRVDICVDKRRRVISWVGKRSSTISCLGKRRSTISCVGKIRSTIYCVLEGNAVFSFTARIED